MPKYMYIGFFGSAPTIFIKLKNIPNFKRKNGEIICMIQFKTNKSEELKVEFRHCGLKAYSTKSFKVQYRHNSIMLNNKLR